MDNHFVEGHCGEYYFSSDTPDSIQGCGEDYGNGDDIIFTFDGENEEELFNKLSKYLTKDLFFTKEELIERLKKCCINNIGVYAAITEVKCNAIYDIDNSKDILNSLFRDNYIDKNMYEKLIIYLNDRLEKQLSFIKEADRISLTISVNKQREKQKEK